MRDTVSALPFWVTVIAVACTAIPSGARGADCPLSDLDCVIFIPLGDLTGGNFRSEVYGLTQNGLVAVGFSDSATAPASGEAFRWQDGHMEGLGSLSGGSTTSRANGIQQVGSKEWIIGAASSAATGSSGLEAFLYSTQDASFTALGFLAGGSNQSSANAVSSTSAAVVVGQSSSAAAGSNGTEAFVYDAHGDILSGLGSLPGGLFSSFATALSASGTVVAGASSSAASGVNATEAFRWEAGEMEGLGFLPGGLDSSAAFAVNSTGTLIAGASTSGESGNNAEEAFLWRNGEMQALGDLPLGPHDSAALAVSTRGVVVGRGTTEAGHRAFIWTEEDGIRDLRDVFEALSGTDLGLWQLHEATAISRDGRIVAGNGLNESNQPEAWILSLPEPSGVLLPLAALASLARLGYRRRSRPRSR